MRRLLAAMALAAVCVACAGAPATTSLPPASVAIVPPEAGLSAAEATSVTLLRRELAAGGFQLSAVNEPVQPAVPPALAAAPAIVYRVELADPDQGFVLIYDLPDPSAAASAATGLAAYLGSGVGQTTYPLDAVFSVAALGSDVIFTWWSPARSSDPATTRAAFERVAAVGDPVAVTK